MRQQRLNGLALMHTHREIPLDLEQILHLLAFLHSRRMRMVHILRDD